MSENLFAKSKNRALRILLTLILASRALDSFGTVVDVDDAFDPHGGADQAVRAVALQNDGKILLAGAFKTFAGQPRRGLVRLLADGQIDSTFGGTGASGMVAYPNQSDGLHALALQPDGKILAAGEFTQFNGESRTNIVRLNTDGSLDSTFRGPWFHVRWSWQEAVAIRTVHLLPGGRMLIGGSFAIADSKGVVVNHVIARLNIDGSVDTSFSVPMGWGQSDWVLSLISSIDDTVVFGGFYPFAGINYAPTSVLRPSGLGIFHPLGGLQANPQSPLERRLFITAVATGNDGRTIAAGGVTGNWWYPEPTWAARLGIARRDADLDPWPDFEADGSINTILVEPDGALLIGGNFTAVNQRLRGGVARFESNGRIDTCFETPVLLRHGFDATPPRALGLARSADGAVFVAGSFSEAGGKPRKGIVKLRQAGQCPPGQVRFGSLEYRVREDDFSAEITLIREGNNRDSVTVQLTSVGGTATPKEDYEPLSQAVAFASGETFKLVKLGLRQDTENEGTESVFLQLSSQPPGDLPPQQATLRIVDSPVHEVAWEADSSFQPPHTISLALVLSSGSILAFDDAPFGYRRLLGLLPNGSLDPTFHPVVVDEWISQVLELKNGDLLLVGPFAAVEGQLAASLVRLKPNGVIDPGFPDCGFHLV